MAARKQTPLKNTKRHPVKLAEIAHGELSLPGTLHSHADQERLGRLWRGLKWLNDDQAELRARFETILSDFDKDKDAKALVDRLQKLRRIPPGKVGEEMPESDPFKGVTEMHFGPWIARETETHDRWWQVGWLGDARLPGPVMVRFGIQQDEAISLAQRLSTSKIDGSPTTIRALARRLDSAWKNLTQFGGIHWLNESNIKTVVEWALEPSTSRLSR